MSEIKDGGPAYPITGIIADLTKEDHKGMSLRDYFAGQVLASQLELGWHANEIARACYTHADAMLKARENKQ